MKYFILIIYEDGTRYEGTISNSKNLKSIPLSKCFEAIRIYYEDKLYSHVIYGSDFVYLNYTRSKFLEYAQWDENEKNIKIVQLKGVNNEKIKSKNVKPTLIGKLLPDDEYERLRLECHRWVP